MIQSDKTGSITVDKEDITYVQLDRNYKADLSGVTTRYIRFRYPDEVSISVVSASITISGGDYGE